MFVWRNKNRSGSISVQIAFKSGSKTKIIKTVGVSKDLNEIDRLSKKAKIMIHEISGKASLLSLPDTEIAIKNFVEGLTNAQICVIGPELVFGKIFNAIGFEQIKDKLFRHLVITRLVYPGSKLKIVDYLQRYKNTKVLLTLHRTVEEECLWRVPGDQQNNLEAVNYALLNTPYGTIPKDGILATRWTKEHRNKRSKTGSLTTNRQPSLPKR